MKKSEFFSIVIGALILSWSGCQAQAINEEQNAAIARHTDAPGMNTGEVPAEVMLTEQTPQDTWDLSSLQMCSPPCWLGIVPGLTDGAEAEKTLEAYFEVEKESLGTRTYLRWLFPPLNEMHNGTIIVDNNVVESISLHFSENKLSLDSVFDKLGEPQFIWWAIGEIPPSNSCGDRAELYYPDIKTLIILADDAEQTQITPSSSVGAVDFLAYTLPNQSRHNQSRPVEWIGYDGDYCLDWR